MENEPEPQAPDRPTAGERERTYAQWFVWTRRNLSPGTDVCHAGAMAATLALEIGSDPIVAAREAARKRAGPGWTAPADDRTRTFAEWSDWARVELGAGPEEQHRAAEAAIEAMDRGADAEAAAAAARAAVDKSATPPPPPHPPHAPPPTPASPPLSSQLQPLLAGDPYPRPIPGEHPHLRQPWPLAAATTVTAPTGAAYWRNPWRIAILVVLMHFPYALWWLWQIFALGRREALPRARSFWWILVPIYGLVVYYRLIADLKDREVELTRTSSLTPLVAILFVIGSWLALAVSGIPTFTGTVSVIWGLLAGGLWASSAFMVQFSANRYLAARYPDERPRGFSGSELAAVGVSLLLVLSVSAAIALSGSGPR